MKIIVMVLHRHYQLSFSMPRYLTQGNTWCFHISDSRINEATLLHAIPLFPFLYKYATVEQSGG